MGTNGCVPGTVMNGMPIGPPLNVPAPKSGCNPAVVLMLFTYAAELRSTGRPSMRRFQMLSAGNTLQPPIVGPPLPPELAVGVADAVGLAVTAAVAGGVRVLVVVGVTVNVDVLLRVAVPVGVGTIGVAVLVHVGVRVGVEVRIGFLPAAGIGNDT